MSSNPNSKEIILSPSLLLSGLLLCWEYELELDLDLILYNIKSKKTSMESLRLMLPLLDLLPS